MSTYFISMGFAITTGLGAVICQIWHAERKLQKEALEFQRQNSETIHADSENIAYD